MQNDDELQDDFIPDPDPHAVVAFFWTSLIFLVFYAAYLGIRQLYAPQ